MTSSCTRAIAFVAALLCSTVFPVLSSYAQTAEKNKETTIDLLANDIERAKGFTIPFDAPAFPALALTGSTVSLGAATPMRADSTFAVGTPLDGVAEFGFAVRPYWLDVFGGDRRSLRAYESAGTLQHLLGRTEISFAATPDRATKAKDASASLGFSTSLLRNSDPRRDQVYAGCVGEVVEYIKTAAPGADRAAALQRATAFLASAPALRWPASARAKISEVVLSPGWSDANQLAQRVQIQLGLPAVWPITTDADGDAASTAKRDFQVAVSPSLDQGYAFSDTILAEKDKRVGACREAATKRYLTQPEVVLGGGARYRSADGDYGSLESSGGGVWLSARIPLNGSAKDAAEGAQPRIKRSINVVARYLADTSILVADKVSQDANETFAAVGVTLETDRWSLKATSARIERAFDSAGIADQTFTRNEITGSWALSDGMWLDFAYGDAPGDVYNEGSYSLVRLRLKQ